MRETGKGTGAVICGDVSAGLDWLCATVGENARAVDVASRLKTDREFRLGLDRATRWSGRCRHAES